MKNLYIAGKIDHSHIIKLFIDAYIADGFNITHDWTLLDSNKLKTADDIDKYAKANISGINRAGILIIVITDPTYEYSCTHTKLGIALALDKYVIVLDLCKNSNFSTNIYTKHKNVKYISYPVDMELLIALDEKLVCEIIALSTAITTIDALKLMKK